MVFPPPPPPPPQFEDYFQYFRYVFRRRTCVYVRDNSCRGRNSKVSWAKSNKRGGFLCEALLPSPCNWICQKPVVAQWRLRTAHATLYRKFRFRQFSPEISRRRNSCARIVRAFVHTGAKNVVLLVFQRLFLFAVGCYCKYWVFSSVISGRQEMLERLLGERHTMKSKFRKIKINESVEKSTKEI